MKLKIKSAYLYSALLLPVLFSCSGSRIDISIPSLAGKSFSIVALPDGQTPKQYLAKDAFLDGEGNFSLENPPHKGIALIRMNAGGEYPLFLHGKSLSYAVSSSREGRDSLSSDPENENLFKIYRRWEEFSLAERLLAEMEKSSDVFGSLKSEIQTEKERIPRLREDFKDSLRQSPMKSSALFLQRLESGEPL